MEPQQEHAPGPTGGRAGTPAAAEIRTVYLEEWQWACCGDEFAIGSEVRWHLDEVSDDDWVAQLLPSSFTGRVTHVENHHGPESAEENTAGIVLSISAALCRYGPTEERAGPHQTVVQGPVPGSGVLEPLHTSRIDPPDEPGPGELTHVGYLVELEVVPLRSAPRRLWSRLRPRRSR